MEALQKHTFPSVVDYVIANNNVTNIGDRFAGEAVQNRPSIQNAIQYIYDDLVDLDNPVRHDSYKLSQVIMGVSDKAKKQKPYGERRVF